ncbi:MAG TPA: hypothetical protein VIJ36_16655 [Thermoanaerobaculia bacterium]
MATGPPDRPVPATPDGSAAIPADLAGRVGRCLRQGLAIRAWWEETMMRRREDRFPLLDFPSRQAWSFGVLGEVPLAEGPLPVMGMHLKMLYNRPKIPPGEARTGERICAQVREFTSRYLLRLSALPQPMQQVSARPGAPVPLLLQPWSWCPSPQGAGTPSFRQLYYRLRATGEIGAFPHAQQGAIVDCRDFGPIYDWVVLTFQIFGFQLFLQPLAPKGPFLRLPVEQVSVVAESPGFVIDRDHPEPGVLGEYGFGYAFLPMPALGADQLQAGFGQTVLRVLANGEIHLRRTVVVNQVGLQLALEAFLDWGLGAAHELSLGTATGLLAPWRRILGQLSSGLEPLLGLAGAANALTGGWVGRSLPLSREGLLKLLLKQEIFYIYLSFLHTISIWNSVPDWTDTSEIPAWLRQW